MISNRKLPFAIAAALLLAAPLAVQAQDAEEEESNFSWSAAYTTDYVFRGVSQSDQDPAFQLGLDYSFGDTGFYVGAWGSNVDFGDGGVDVEVDVFVGWNHDFSDELNFDVMLNRYHYLGGPDESSDGDYVELISALAWKEMITATVGYTNDVYDLGENGWYYALAGSWEVGGGFSLGAGVGLSTFDEETGIEDYSDWNLSVSRDFGPINAALGYYDTDSDGEYNFGDTADDRLVLTFSIEG